MSRTPVPTNLVHRAADVARDAQVLEELGETAARVVRNAVHTALARDLAAAGADEWLGAAHAALASVLRDPGVLEDADQGTLREGLVAALESEGPGPDEAVVESEARALGRAIATAWSGAIARALDGSARVDLDEALLPRGEGHEAMARAALESVGAAFGVRGAALSALMEVVCEAWLGAGTPIELPGCIRVEREVSGYVAYRMGEERVLASEVVESGTRLRGDVEPPSGVRGGDGRGKR